MSLAEVILNLAILALVLRRNLGTHGVGPRRFLFSAALIVLVAAIFLRHVPDRGHDVALELAGLGIGCALGLVAGAIPRVWRDDLGAVWTTAGLGFALVWSAVVGVRLAF